MQILWERSNSVVMKTKDLIKLLQETDPSGEMDRVVTNIDIFVEDHTDRSKTINNEVCGHLDNGCSIYGREPIHCALPLIKFKRVKNVTHITREVFSRNHNMKCPVGFVRQGDSTHISDLILSKLSRVKDWAEEWGIKSWVPEILEEVNLHVKNTDADFFGSDIKQEIGISNIYLGKELK